MSTVYAESLIEIYADGACRGNPGPGGWGAVVLSAEGDQEMMGATGNTTNNRMELCGVLEGLRALSQPARVRVYTDSTYVCKGMTEWIAGWKRRNWRTAGGRAVKNQDLWLALDEAQSHHEVEWQWVRGHAGNAGNERADGLANLAIDRWVANCAMDSEGGS
jgi:ribonuclease HI|tara:strand:+ start:312 stop:797 length:486 start_codon:yes stop_codon:yes gene_type:complete